MQVKWFNPLSKSIGRRAMSVLVVVSLGGVSFHMKKTYSPGPLSATQRRGETLGGFHSHADFEKECKHCHAPVHCISATNCQECHIEIARQRAEADGLHGVLPDTNKCTTCHVEHRGRDAVISRFPLANVDHDRLTGYSLDRHQASFDGAPLVCADCHAQHRYDDDSVDCVTCHADADPGFMTGHRELYGDDCIRCHDGRGGTADFEHGQVFALEDGHDIDACEECHSDQTFARPARDCVACHEEPDVHAGQFGVDCSRCHTALNWTETQLTRHTFRLDHGGAGEVACETCHIDWYVEHTCYECHDHTPTQMREVHAENDIVDFENCIECHPTGRPGEGRRYQNGE